MGEIVLATPAMVEFVVCHGYCCINSDKEGLEGNLWGFKELCCSFRYRAKVQYLNCSFVME
jgi:hypothetical protein